MKITIHCDGPGCDSHLTVEAEAPGWVTRINPEHGGESSYTFCPTCAPMEPWFDVNCPGCVSGYPDCGLGKATNYGKAPGLTAAQEAVVRGGRCPFRVNGTFGTSARGIVDIDLSTIAPTESGVALLAGFARLRAWLDEYHAREAAERARGRRW